MAFDDLTQFLQATADAGELERVGVPLSLREEIAGVTQEICREFGERSPVVLSESPQQSSIPVVTNLLGNFQRLLRSCGSSSIDEILGRFQAVLNPFQQAGRDWKFGLGNSATAPDRSRYLPRVIRRAACQQVVKLGKELNLDELPLLQCWAGESGPAITAGLVISESLDNRPNIDLVPAGRIDRQTLAVSWTPSHAAYAQWQHAQEGNHPFPVAIALGGDPLLTYVASLPLPQMFDPWLFAGILRNESVNLIRARTVELNVPADAEIVLEGYLDPAAGAVSGRFAGKNGLLETRNDLAVLRLSAITHRANPIFPARVQAFDFQEDFVTSQLTERMLLKLLQLINGTVVDLHLPVGGGHRQLVFVSTTASDAAQVQQLFQAISSLPMLTESSILVAVSARVDLRNADAVWREACVRLGVEDSALSRTVKYDTGRLWIDATDSAGSSSTRNHRCQASPQVLAQIAERLGNAHWESVDEGNYTPSQHSI
ncbi:UbiD family decarboxylase domain-containing protein [Planctomicrobium sp. SH527]|uniref:UbiD family decarboxylase domain-containing protein n=1 Tax=Planctomicrobium sp. SH527 TaxID=3448123 RepID=UPI003F5BD5EF